MNKFPASVVKGTGFTLNRAEGQFYYNIVKAGQLVGAQSPNVGHVYKDTVNEQYVIHLNQTRTVANDFNAAKAAIKLALAA